MGDKAPFSVRFWGVRGSIACSGPRTARYGGNTSSLEVRCGEQLLLFDAGTGIRYLGKTLEGARIDGDIYFTHTHFDHVCGLPFFRPMFQPQNRFRLWAGHLRGAMTLKRVLAEFMMSPLFPVPPEVFRATLEYRDFNAGETLPTPKGITLRTAALNHPDGSTGYRVEYDGRSFCPRCGSRIGNIDEDGVEIRLGSLDDAPFELKPEAEIWIKRREPWLHAVEGASQHQESRR